jgi:selenocysteine-specific elongation factor
VRPLAGNSARLTLSRPLPLEPGDRAILRDPGQKLIAAGLTVADIDPPELRRRGAAARRGEDLQTVEKLDPVAEVERRGAIRVAELAGLGVELQGLGGVRRVGDWLIGSRTWQHWIESLLAAADGWAASSPLNPGLPLEAARQAVQIPTLAILAAVAQAAGLQAVEGRVQRPGTIASLGAAEPGLARLEGRLRADPFAAPERSELESAGLGAAELAAAARLGRILRLRDDVVLLPDAAARAMRVLAAMSQPFTTSDARQHLGTTRRVAIPLLEHLDERGWTRRIDAGHREVVRP